MSGSRVMVVGLDGASFDVISSLVKEGHLVNFKRLIENGCFGTLHSTSPPLSPVAWPSLFTGTNPDKHKMFDFVHYENGLLIPHNSSSIRGKALWDILNIGDKRIILLNVPFTFPPYKVNGFMISGFPSPRNKVASYPVELISLLKSNIGQYYVDAEVNAEEGYRGLDEEKFLKEVNFVAKKRAEAMYYLMENFEWDFFMVVFTILDRVQHLLFGYFDEESPFYTEEKRSVVIECYKEMDNVLGKAVSLLSQNTAIMVVSDHGFEPLYKYVGVNNLLVQGGFIKPKKRPTIFTQERIYRLFRRMSISLDHQKTIFPQKIMELAQKVIPPSINFHDSIAYSIYPSSVSINKEKTKQENEYEKTKTRLTNFFYSIVDEETGNNIVERIYCKDEGFSREETNDGPDLTMVFRKGYQPCVYRTTWVNCIDRPPKEFKITGIHFGSSAQRGVFVVCGEGIKKNWQIEAKIVDVAPTILHMLGVPIPSHIEGRVLKEIFEIQSRLAKRPTKFKEAVSLMQKTKKLCELSKEEEEDMKKRLRSLGYF